MDKRSIMKRIDALEAALPANRKISLVIIKLCKPEEAEYTGKAFKVTETRLKRSVTGVLGVTYDTTYIANYTDYKRTEANTGPIITLVRRGERSHVYDLEGNCIV